MASDGDTDGELNHLSSADLVRHLQTTNRMVDYEIATRVLGERERRAAEVEACLQAKIDALRRERGVLVRDVPDKEKEEVHLKRIIIETNTHFKAVLASINTLQRKHEAFLIDLKRSMDEVEANLKSALTMVDVLQDMQRAAAPTLKPLPDMVEANEVITSSPALDLHPVLDLCLEEVDLAIKEGQKCQQGQGGKNAGINNWKEEQEVVRAKVHSMAVFDHDPQLDLTARDEITVPTFPVDLPPVLDLHQEEADLAVEEGQGFQECLGGKHTDINGQEEKEDMMCANVDGVATFCAKPLPATATALTTHLPPVLDFQQQEVELLVEESKECRYGQGDKNTDIDSNKKEVSYTNRSSSYKRKSVDMDNTTIPPVMRKKPGCIGNNKSTKNRGRPRKGSNKPAPTMSNDFRCWLQLQLPLSSSVPSSMDVSLPALPITSSMPPPAVISFGPPLLLESDNQERKWGKKSLFSELGSVEEEYGIEEESAPLPESSMQRPSLELMSMGGSPIASADVATIFPSVPDMSPPLVEESNQPDIEMQNTLSNLDSNIFMNQVSFDAWMEESGGSSINEQVPLSLVLPFSSESASLLSKIKTSLWESEENMVITLKGNVELCMVAICALYRQKKLIVELTSKEPTKFTTLSERQASRATKLAEYLLDGDINGPVKKNKEDLVNHDATAPKFIEELVIHCSKQLFDIYRNNEDPYFC
ncbi:hypothetical protein E2562_017634 [Oryza meyeriana var. granulata]|uniref:Uncharacterized protein n=1 Tax=Oryza meyeriana var. granulata TaxID=110450 RepID=A0A6G1BYC1_9ORYZ|nr:hypothetical protein E2562_017634 [Oryza meyeriana var. granulata]